MLNTYPFSRKPNMNEFTSGMKQEPQKSSLAKSLLMSVILASFLMMIHILLHSNKQLKVQVMTDPITDLPNKRALEAALDQELKRAQRYHRAFSVLFLDLDYFKLINDVYGHSVGNAVLREFAGVVRPLLRQSDILGRVGGDEFLVILPETAEVGAQHVIERIQTTLAKHLLISGSGFHLTCSIGSATFPFTAQERELLIDAADQAMYAAKRQAHKHKYSAPTTHVVESENSRFTQNMLEVALR